MGEDYVSRIEFDNKNKKFKTLPNKQPNNTNLTNSLIYCALYPISQNYNDRYDRLFLKSLKIVLAILTNNLFSIKISGFQFMFETLSLAIKTARQQATKVFIKQSISKIFDTINHRLTLCNFFFKASNPLNYFYTPVTRKMIQTQSNFFLSNLVDKT